MIGARNGWPEVAGGWENPALPAGLADDFMVTIYFDCLMSGYGDQLRVFWGVPCAVYNFNWHGPLCFYILKMDGLHTRK